MKLIVFFREWTSLPLALSNWNVMTERNSFQLREEWVIAVAMFSSFQSFNYFIKKMKLIPFILEAKQSERKGKNKLRINSSLPTWNKRKSISHWMQLQLTPAAKWSDEMIWDMREWTERVKWLKFAARRQLHYLISFITLNQSNNLLPHGSIYFLMSELLRR